MGERGGTGGQDLEERVEVLSAVVIVLGVRVHLLKVAREPALLVLHADDVLVHAAEEEPLEAPEQDGTVVPRAVGPGAYDGLVHIAGELLGGLL